MAKKYTVTRGYRGKDTGNRYIAPGDYNEDDPALFGLGESLVELGRARSFGEPATLATIPVDRDLSGKPIELHLPENQLVTDPVRPIYDQFPNNADASQVIQPFEYGAAVPAVTAGNEGLIGGNIEVKTAVEAAAELEQARDLKTVAADERAAAKANLEGSEAPNTGGKVSEDEGASAVDYDDMSLELLREHAGALQLELKGNESRAQLIKKIKDHVEPLE
jgi:hypothetical protein